MENKPDSVTTPTERKNESNAGSGKQRVIIAVIVIAIVGELICFGLLVQGFITGQPAYERPLWSNLEAENRLLGYYSHLISTAGLVAILVAANCAILADNKQKKLGYCWAVVGVIFLFLS